MERDAQDNRDDDPRDSLYYRCIQFKNGDVVIAGIPFDDIEHTKRQYIEIYTPLRMVPSTVTEGGETYNSLGMQKWQPLADEDYFEIATDTILTMFIIKPKYEERYFSMLDRLYFADLQELLEDETVSEEVKEGIEEELAEMSAEQEEDQTPEIQSSKYLH